MALRSSARNVIVRNIDVRPSEHVVHKKVSYAAVRMK